MKRKLQFVAGPGTYEFYACGEHRRYLEDADVSNFVPILGEGPKLCDEEDAENNWCDFHREG